jgi:hypothetical protein
MTAPSILIATLFLGALTPAKVDNVKTNSNAATHPPPVIYVDTFSVSQTAPNDDGSADSGRPHLFGMLRGGEQNTLIGKHKAEEYQETLAKLPSLLQKTLVQELSQSIAHASAGDGSDAQSGKSWLITGKFIVVDQGSGAAQAGVGLGAGQSHVEVQAQVYTIRDTQNPFLVFDSKGASGHMPGYAVMGNPYVAAAKFVMSKREPEKETKKIAKAIAKEIGKFMESQGIPTLEQMKKAQSN